MPSPNTLPFQSTLESEVDTGAAAIEVVILWGEHSILHVEHLSPPRMFSVGDATDARGKRTTDFLIGSDTLGTAHMPIVAMLGERPAVVIPAAADGDIAIGDEVVSLYELAAQGQLQAAEGGQGTRLYVLPLAATARVRFRGFTFVVRRVSAARKIGVGHAHHRAGEHAWTAASLLFHAGLLLAFQLLPPKSAALAIDLLNADSRLVAYLVAPPETVEREPPVWLREDSVDANGGTGKRHEAEEGQNGERASAQTQHKFGIQTQRTRTAPQLSRVTAQSLAKNAGIIGVLRASALDTSTPTSMFGREAAVGQDPESALASLIGDAIGMNHGIGGLSARGTGRGGGGDGRGTIGVGTLGTIGRGSGTGSGDGAGVAAGSFRSRVARVPQIKTPPGASILGSLSKETIRRVIGRHINEVRYCYAQQLNARPDLQGRVTTQFIIAPSGEVRTAAISSSDLGSPEVERCIARAAARWVFPAPEGGGIVVVTYPFVLSQAGG